MNYHYQDTIDSMLSESLAYIEQGSVCLDDNDKTNAATMLKIAEDLIRETEKLEGAKSSKLYAVAVDSLRKLESRCSDVEVVELKKTAQLGAPPTSKKEHEAVDAELLYWLPEGVQLVTIEDGQTATPSPPTSLAIFAVEQPEKSGKLYPDLEAAGYPKALIQVGPWVYPLNIETSTIMKNEMGIYVMPNPTSDHPDMFVGIILPRDISKKLEEEFLSVLESYAVVRESSIVEEMSPDQRSRTSERIASFLLKTGQRLASSIQSVADKSEAYMSEKGEKYRANLTPTDKPVNINPALRYGVFTVYRGSKAFAKVTRFVLEKVGEVGVNIGNRLAKSMSGPSGSGRLVGSSATVIGGGIAGASLIWIALEDASRQLFRSLSDETVQIVKVHYGDPASETSRHALHAAGHTTLSAFQLWDLGPRSIAGRVARKAGIQFVHGMSHKDSSASLSGSAGKKRPLEESDK